MTLGEVFDSSYQKTKRLTVIILEVEFIKRNGIFFLFQFVLHLSAATRLSDDISAVEGLGSKESSLENT